MPCVARRLRGKAEGCVVLGGGGACSCASFSGSCPLLCVGAGGVRAWGARPRPLCLSLCPPQSPLSASAPGGGRRPPPPGPAGDPGPGRPSVSLLADCWRSLRCGHAAQLAFLVEGDTWSMTSFHFSVNKAAHTCSSTLLRPPLPSTLQPSRGPVPGTRGTETRSAHWRGGAGP